MTEIVSKWIQHRLGLVIDMTPDNFAIKTANGYLLAQIIHSYQIIVPEQLELIVESDLIKQCYENFQHISLWLIDLNISVLDEDLYEIVHGVGTASLHLFYRLFLELKDKTQLDFLTDNEINAQIGSKFNRFELNKEDDIREDPNKINLHMEGLCEPLLAGGDVYHWYKDRIENLQSRCKEARDEYVHILKTRCRSCGIDHPPRINESGFVLARSIISSPKPSIVTLDPNRLPDEDVSYNDRTYDELVNDQKEAQQLGKIIPNPKEVKKIIKNLKQKSKTRHENKLLRNELHQEIMNEFDDRINESKLKSEDRVLTRTFLRQSCFEKEVISKLGQVKMQKEYMIENKSKQAEILNKLKESEFVSSVILQAKELDEKKLTFYLERERVLQLHKKIWQEKLHLRSKRHQELCSNALKDIIDISIKVSDYKARFGQEPTRREMNELKNMFVSGQPVFDICEPIINIIKDNDEVENIDEENLAMETFRQNAVDQEEFDSYVKYEWPWELKHIETTPETLEQISCGLNVLGHIVYQALLAKYPPPPAKEKPYFPYATIRVCVNGLSDVTYVPILRDLLSDREIEVVELSQAVDFCVKAYQIENRRELDEDDVASVKEGKKKKEKPTKEPKGQKSKQKSKMIKLEDVEPQDDISKVFENKKVQTPLVYPCEEIAFSPQALLGKTAQELLDLGLPLTDDLLVSMFVEYLKSFPNLKGWALINYPTNYEQAAILEEALTGINILMPRKTSPVKNDILEIADIEEDDHSDIGSDMETKRHSQLLHNPVVERAIKVYDTILTAYIKIKKITNEEVLGYDILPPVFEELGNDPDPLDKFYSDTGANYSLYYKDFDRTTLKYLGKLIIGDYSLPLKSSIELFGDGINCMDLGMGPTRSLKAMKTGEKEKKPKTKEKSPASTTVESSEKKTAKGSTDKKGKAKVKVVIVHEDKYTQIPSEDEFETEEIFVQSDIQIPTAGQEGWEYIVVPCPEELMIAISTIWETIEEIYINDLKQVFFLKRLNMNCIMPYVQYIKDIMKKNIDKPDYKGFLLAKFQKAFNVFDMDFRQDKEFKAEMYCRIEDFKEKLAEMCDGNMMDSENIRCAIINGNWTTNQVTELFNDYINMFQIELDRFTDTVRLINDYFMGVFTGKPSEDELWKEENFAKIAEINPAVVNDMLLNIDQAVDLSFFDILLSNMIQKATACIKKLNTHSANNIDRLKTGPTSNTSKSKASSPKSKASKDDKKSTQIEIDVVKENKSKLVEEWQCAVKGESLRVALRLDLLKFNALQTLQEFFNTVQGCFHKVFNDIQSNYGQEIKNIENACKVFHRAVENEKPVQKELIFTDHTFYVNPEINLFDNALIIPELTKEIVEEGAFTIGQLSTLAHILMDLCPNGYMLRASFTYFLQDIIWNNPEDGSGPMAPRLWQKLEPSVVKKIIDALYDDLEYVYWRDFIVYNLRIKFPTEKELLVTLKRLRACDPDSTELVQDYQFNGTKLWFECFYKIEDASKVKAIKQLLSKLYYVKDCGINYTALLLDFCKDEDYLAGFARALELSLGKIVCWQCDMGKSFEDNFLTKVLEHDTKVQLRDEERDEYYRIAHDEVRKLVDYVVHISEDVIIEDYVEDPQITKDTKRVKKLDSKVDATKKPRRSSLAKRSTNFSAEGRKSSKGDETKFTDVVENASRENSKEINENMEEESEDSVAKLCRDLPDNVYTDSVEYTQVVFFLPLDVLLPVITTALPWHSRAQRYDDLSFWERTVEIYEKCKNPKFNMSVLAHQFLNTNEFLNHLAKTKKFTALDPVRIVKNILDNVK